MDVTKLRREAPVTGEHLHRILVAEYYMDEGSDKQKQIEINTKTIQRYMMEPTNLVQLKSLLLGTNNSDVRDYFFYRFNNCLNDLKALIDHADANEKTAQIIGGSAAGAAVGFIGGGVALSRSALAVSGTSASALAAYALTIGTDMIFAGGILTATGLASWLFVRTYKKEKIGLKYPIRNVETFVSEIKMLREG
jgi:hypothetical protein